ncbi:hypothetical protein [Blautia wexlerae]|nr:hypothetical protein [Blautia wexlerae]
MAELTENAKDYIECLKDILQRKYLLSGEKAFRYDYNFLYYGVSY